MNRDHSKEAARHEAEAERLTRRATRIGSDTERLERLAEFHRAAAALHDTHANHTDQPNDC